MQFESKLYAIYFFYSILVLVDNMFLLHLFDCSIRESYKYGHTIIKIWLYFKTSTLKNYKSRTINIAGKKLLTKLMMMMMSDDKDFVGYHTSTYLVLSSSMFI